VEPDFGARWADAFALALEWAADGRRPLSDLVPPPPPRHGAASGSLPS
jgi:hypothetical protein